MVLDACVFHIAQLCFRGIVMDACDLHLHSHAHWHLFKIVIPGWFGSAAWFWMLVCLHIAQLCPVASLWMRYPHMHSHDQWHLIRMFVLSLQHGFGCMHASYVQPWTLVLVQGSITWLGCLCNMVLDACVSSYCTALPLWYRYGCVIHTCTAMFSGTWSGSSYCLCSMVLDAYILHMHSHGHWYLFKIVLLG
jgi:hypothetical protein